MVFERGVLRASPAPQRVGDGEGRNGATAAEVSRVDVHETSAVQILNAMNENIRSLREVDFLDYGVARPSSLVSLSLHSNRLSSLEGFASLTALTALNLSSNNIDGSAIRSCAPHLGGLSSLESLDLSCNRIDALLGLPFLPRLNRLLVPYNRLESLNGVQALASSLTHLDARDNRIAGPIGAHAPHLAALGRLKTLVLASTSGGGGGGGRGGQSNNPLCASRGYRRDVFAAAARSLEMLDGRAADTDELEPPDAPGEPGAEGAANTTIAAPPTPLSRVPAAATAEQGESRARRGPRGGGDWGTVAAAGGGVGGAPASRGADGSRAGLTRAAAAAAAAPLPEEVPVMPRFNALAGRFRSRRSRGGGKRGGEPMLDGSGRKRGDGRWRGGGEDNGEGGRSAEDNDDEDDDDSYPFESSLGDGGWSGDSGDDDGASVENRTDTDRPAGGGVSRRHPEETASRAVAERKGRSRGDRREIRGGVGGGAGAGGSGDEDALLPPLLRGEDAAEEEQGLLSRLRSIAQEARLEVMDSRLQDLHEKQARDASAARRAAADAAAAAEASAAAAAASRRGVSSSTRRQGITGSGTSVARGGTRSNPWTNQQAAQPGAAARRVVSRNVRSSESTTAGLRSNGDDVGGRSTRPTKTDAFESAAGYGVGPGGGGGVRSGGESSTVTAVFAPSYAGAVPRSTYFEGAPALAEAVSAKCPCCGVRDLPEVTLAVGAGGGMEGAACRGGGQGSETPPVKHLSDASTQAIRGPGAAAFRSTGVARTRRIATAGIASTTSGALGKVASGGDHTGVSRGALSVGRAVGAAAVAGAAAAALSGFEARRVSACFFKWAREADRAKLAAATAAADAALAAAREEAQRERKAWEALQAALEGSAAAREREAREAAEENGRKEIRSVSAAYRVAEEEASALKRRLEEVEAEIAAAVVKQQQAQAEASRARAAAEVSVASSEARAAAATERLEEQLRGKARAESEAEEESRRLRALLRESESRVRGLQDQMEESRARERRAAADADDARRRAAMDADKKLAAAVDAERDRIVLLKHKLEAAEDGARAAARAARSAAEGEAKARRAASELADLARQQKAALQTARGEIRAARAEGISAQEAAEAMKAEASRRNAEIEQLRGALEACETELTGERQARRQHQKDLQAAEARAEELNREKGDAEAKAAASSTAEGDLRTALMVKDKVLEDREKLVKELRLREADALSEAQGWRDRLEAQQSDAEHRLDAAREEVSELQAQVVALSGVEDQLREVFKELRRYRRRHEAEEGANGGGGGDDHDSRAPPRDGKGRRRERDSATELTAVAAVTAAAKAVEEELRGQLEAKDEALRYVENELLGMKSLFENKEACLRRELNDERDKLAREVGVLKQQLEQAEAGRAAAEENARQQEVASGVLHTSLRNANHRSKELEETLRALLLKHTSQMAAAEATSRKLSKMAAMFQQLQDQDSGESSAVETVAPAHVPASSLLNSSTGSGTTRQSGTRHS